MGEKRQALTSLVSSLLPPALGRTKQKQNLLTGGGGMNIHDPSPMLWDSEGRKVGQMSCPSGAAFPPACEKIPFC